MKVEGPLFHYEARIVGLVGEVDHSQFILVADQLLRLDTHRAKPITLYISCRGGSLIDALVLVDIMERLRSPVRAIGMGLIGGAGTLALVCARERLVLPGCVLSAYGLYQFPVSQAASLEETLQPRTDALRNKYPGLNAFLKSKEPYISAREAVQLGLADRIYTHDVARIPPRKVLHASR